jgi:hypothetical protein
VTDDPITPDTSEPPEALRTLLPRPWAIWFWRNARKWVVGVIGGTILLLGVAMLVLPGPGWVTIFAGLALLATEFAWARWMLKEAKTRLGYLLEAAKNGVGLETGNSSPPAPRTPVEQSPKAR